MCETILTVDETYSSIKSAYWSIQKQCVCVCSPLHPECCFFFVLFHLHIISRSVDPPLHEKVFQIFLSLYTAGAAWGFRVVEKREGIVPIWREMHWGDRGKRKEKKKKRKKKKRERFKRARLKTLIDGTWRYRACRWNKGFSKETHYPRGR